MAIDFDWPSNDILEACTAVMKLNPHAAARFDTPEDMKEWAKNVTNNQCRTNAPGYWSTMGLFVCIFEMDGKLCAKGAVAAYTVNSHAR